MTDHRRPAHAADDAVPGDHPSVPDQTPSEHPATDSGADHPASNQILPDGPAASQTVPNQIGPNQSGPNQTGPETAATAAFGDPGVGSAVDPGEAPTGEVITGPIRPVPETPTHAYAPESRPATKQMDAFDSAAFGPVPTASSPSSPPPPPENPVRSSPAGKRGRGRTIGLIVAAVVLLVVIAGVGSELYIRNKVTDCLQASFDNLTGTSTDVSVSRRPMLMSMVDGQVPWVQVDTTSGGDTTMRLHARADGISTDGGTVKSLVGNGFLPYDRIQAMSSGTQNGSPTIESITANQAAGTLKIATTVNFAIIPVPATVTLKPVVKDGAVTFEVKEATALVFGLPSDFAQPIVDQVTNAMFGPLFKQIKVTKLDVGRAGIDFAFDGTDVNLKSAAESTGTTSASGGGGCAV